MGLRVICRATFQTDWTSKWLRSRHFGSSERCPLLPVKADIEWQSLHVSFGPTTDSCSAAKRLLFDHLVGARKQLIGAHDKAKGSCSFQIDDQLEFGRLYDRQVGRLGALENFSGGDACLTILFLGFRRCHPAI